VRGRYSITLRDGPRVKRDRFASLDDALSALGDRVDAIAGAAHREPVKVLSHEYAPVQQVVGRGQLRGPGGLRAGIDVRGDGSREAWTGRWRRTVVEQRPGEDTVGALRRTLGPTT
jgi:hypothetical protein